MKKLISFVLLVSMLLTSISLVGFAADYAENGSYTSANRVELVAVKRNYAINAGQGADSALTDGMRGTTTTKDLWMGNTTGETPIADDANLNAETKEVLTEGGFTHYIMFEYSDVATFGGYNIHFMSWGAQQIGVMLGEWTVFASTDGTNWTVAEEVTGNTNPRALRMYAQPVEAKYFIWANKGISSVVDPSNSNASYHRISELDFNIPANVVVTNNFSPKSYVAPSAAEVSSSEYNPAFPDHWLADPENLGYSNNYHLVDGKTVAGTGAESYKTTFIANYAAADVDAAKTLFGDSLVTTEAINGYFLFDFKDVLEFATYDVYAATGKSFAEGWKVFASEDGTTWEKVDTVAAGDVADTTSRAFADFVEARYFALCPVAPASETFCEITEISFNAGRKVASITGDNVAVTKADGTAVAANDLVTMGSTLTITGTPAQGGIVDTITVDGVEVDVANNAAEYVVAAYAGQGTDAGIEIALTYTTIQPVVITGLNPGWKVPADAEDAVFAWTAVDAAQSNGYELQLTRGGNAVGNKVVLAANVTEYDFLDIIKEDMLAADEFIFTYDVEMTVLGNDKGSYTPVDVTGTFEKEIEIILVPLAAPANVTLDASGNVSWDAVTDAASYKVSVYKNGSLFKGPYTTTATTYATGEVMVDAGNYTVKVSALPADGTLFIESAAGESGAFTVEAKKSSTLIFLPVFMRYNITYHANNGDRKDVQAGGSYPLNTVINAPENTFTNEGKTFAGWNTSADGKGTTYVAGAKIIVNQHLHLYAMWK